MHGHIIMLTILLSSIALLLLVSLSNISHCNMTDRALDWLRDKAVGWSHSPPVNKIDTHHHCVPRFYAKGMLYYLFNASR